MTLGETGEGGKPGDDTTVKLEVSVVGEGGWCRAGWDGC